MEAGKGEKLLKSNREKRSCLHVWFSLRFVFTILITFLVILTTGFIMTILIVTQRNSWEATFIREITSQSETVNLLIDSLLREPERSTRLVATSLQLNERTDALDVGTVRRAMWPAFSSEPNFDGMYMSLTNDRLVGYQRMVSSVMFYAGDSYSNLRIYAPVDQVNGTGPLLSDHGTLHRASTRSLVSASRDFASPIWTDVSIGENALPFITYAYPLYNSTSFNNREFLGIVFVDYLLSLWSEYLRDIKVGRNGVVYVMSSDGALVTSSHANITCFSRDEKTGVYVRNYATSDSMKKNSPLVFHSSRFILGTHIKNEQVYALQMQPMTNLIIVRREVQLVGGIRWYIVVVFNRNDFARSSLNANIAAYTVAPVLVALSCIIGFLVTFGITRQISSLSDMMRDVANMNLDHIDLDMKPSCMAELGQMQIAFVRMVRNMIEFRAFMPDNVLNELLEETCPQLSTTTSNNQISPSYKDTVDNLCRKGSDSMTDSLSNSDIDLSKFGLGLKERSISLLSVQIINFYELLERVGHSDIIHMHGDLVHEITAIVQQRKGVILNFTHSEVVAIWNSNRSHQYNPIHASKCAVQILTRLSHYNQRNTSRNLPELRLKIAVASGVALVGNMGTSKTRKFAIIGNIVSRLQTIQKLQCSVNRIFFDETTKQVCRRLFLTTPVVSFSLSQSVSVENINASTTTTTTTAAIPNITLTDNYLIDNQQFCVFRFEGYKKSTNNDEWMYEMEVQQVHEDYEVVDEAFKLYFIGSYADALKRLNMTELKTPSCIEVAEKLRFRIMEIYANKSQSA